MVSGMSRWGMTTACDKPQENGSSSRGMAQQRLFLRLVEGLGGRCASALGINLSGMESQEIFKWFLAALLLSTRADERVVARTYKEFKKAGGLSPEAILTIGQHGLEVFLARGGCGEHNSKAAAKILEVARGLKEKYEGDLNRLHFFAEDERDLARRLRGLGRGIGPATVNRFLRELRYVWEKAAPPLPESARLASWRLGLTRAADGAGALHHMKAMFDENQQGEGEFSDFEAALVRLGSHFCRKNRCSLCPMAGECREYKYLG